MYMAKVVKRRQRVLLAAEHASQKKARVYGFIHEEKLFNSLLLIINTLCQRYCTYCKCWFVIWWTEKCEWMVALDLFSSPLWWEADMSRRTDRDVCCCGGVQVQVCHWGFNLHTVCAPACQRVHLHVWYLHVNLCEDKLCFKVKSEDIIKRPFLTQRIIWDCFNTSCVRTCVSLWINRLCVYAYTCHPL